PTDGMGVSSRQGECRCATACWQAVQAPRGALTACQQAVAHRQAGAYAEPPEGATRNKTSRTPALWGEDVCCSAVPPASRWSGSSAGRALTPNGGRSRSTSKGAPIASKRWKD